MSWLHSLIRYMSFAVRYSLNLGLAWGDSAKSFRSRLLKWLLDKTKSGLMRVGANQSCQILIADAALNSVSLQYDVAGRRTKNATGTSVLYSGANAVQELFISTPPANLLAAALMKSLLC